MNQNTHTHNFLLYSLGIATGAMLLIIVNLIAGQGRADEVRGNLRYAKDFRHGTIAEEP